MRWNMNYLRCPLVCLLGIILPSCQSDYKPVVGDNRTDSTMRWSLCPEGGGIRWIPETNLPHEDHIEMSGFGMSLVLRYGVDADRHYRDEKSLVFPCLRTIPNNTHASLYYRIATDVPSLLSVNGKSLVGENVDSVKINGRVDVYSRWAVSKASIGIESQENADRCIGMARSIFPSVTEPAAYEKVTVTNNASSAVTLYVPEYSQVFRTDPAKGVDGAYIVRCDIKGEGTFTLAEGESYSFCLVYQAYKDGCKGISSEMSVDDALMARNAFTQNVLGESLVLETPDAIVDGMFRFAKIRGAESIYRTKSGLMHGPGGESYYAAIWANDQAEYINPFFPFLGYAAGNESAIHSFDLFAGFMNDGYEPIPSSIIAEGYDIWNGAGDRGDAAMIAYGASRFALAYGDISQARHLWPLIQWCLEYCRRRINADGVVTSDTDELENRFESGDANLCTSVLYYDALVSASYLAGELGEASQVSDDYASRAAAMAGSIQGYFAANVSGYDTYRYYDGNDKLRSWICMPLIAGLNDRKDGTIAALTGPELMTENGCLTEQGSDVFWDRSTLYALRGIFYTGETETAMDLLHYYSRTRLLGEHVPYAIEAWPEGSQRHLSAESGLYCRAITEGLFGIRPTGLRSFTMNVSLPEEWDRMALRHMKAFGGDFDVVVSLDNDGNPVVTVSESNGNVRTYVPVDGKVEIRLQEPL